MTFCLIYACLSAVVWVAFRAAEAGLVRARPARQPVTRPRRLPRATAEVLLVTEGVAS